MDPVTIAAAVAAISALGALVKPFYDVLRSYTSRSDTKNVKISITLPDGTIKTLETAAPHAKTMSEEEIRKLVELLTEAENERSEDSSEK